jgi:hypothetical protein
MKVSDKKFAKILKDNGIYLYNGKYVTSLQGGMLQQFKVESNEIKESLGIFTTKEIESVPCIKHASRTY